MIAEYRERSRGRPEPGPILDRLLANSTLDSRSAADGGELG
jgi:hypothetical protein